MIVRPVQGCIRSSGKLLSDFFLKIFKNSFTIEKPNYLCARFEKVAIAIAR